MTVLKGVFEVLVVDDEPKDKLFVRELLEDRGFAVVWCEGWKDIDWLLSHRVKNEEPAPDVVLVDMHFGEPYLGANPNREGLLIIQELERTCTERGLEPPPVIGFTSKVKDLERESMIEAGVVDFISASEYKRSTQFVRRLVQSVQDAGASRRYKAASNEEIQNAEEQIVGEVLRNEGDDPKQAAVLLDWPVEQVEKIRRRLREKEII